MSRWDPKTEFHKNSTKDTKSDVLGDGEEKAGFRSTGSPNFGGRRITLSFEDGTRVLTFGGGFGPVTPSTLASRTQHHAMVKLIVTIALVDTR